MKPSYDYDQAGAQISRSDSKWDAGGLGAGATIQYSFTDNASLSGNFQQFTTAQIDLMQQAMSYWEQVADVTFVWVDEGATGQNRFSTDGDLEIYADPTIGGGYATYSSTSNVITTADVVIGIPADSLTTMVHELGHAMGLSHPGDYDLSDPVTPTYANDAIYAEDTDQFTIMSYFDSITSPLTFVQGSAPNTFVGFAPEAPMLHDIAAIQRLYGSNTNASSGDSIYGFNNNTGFDEYGLTSTDSLMAVAIHDTGGIDTLDLSGYMQASVIDLNEEAFSSFGSGFDNNLDPVAAVNNFAIGRGTVIENAIGGAGDDAITGNDADNTLQGLLGDDTITGGGGNDTLDGAAAGVGVDAARFVELNSDTVSNRAMRIDTYDAMPGSITLDMILRIDAGVTHSQRIASYDPTGANDLGFDLQLWDDSFPNLALIDRNGTSLSTISTGVTKAEIGDGEIHRLTVSRNSTTGEYRVYLDGVYQGGGTADVGQSFTSGGAWAFGQSQGIWGAANDPNFAMEGDIADIALYDAVLSDADVAARSLNDFTDPADTRLVSHWVPGLSTTSVTDQQGGVAMTLDNVATVALIDFDSDDDNLNGGAGNDTLFGRDGDDTLLGGGGNDTLDGGDGADSLIGGGGRDTADYSAATTITRADLELSGTNTGGAAGDTYSGIEDLIGGSNANSLRGDSAGNNLTGGGNTDLLFGRTGDDTLRGNAGNDLIFGGNGADSIDGGSGNDVASYADSGINVTADLLDPTANTNFAAGDTYTGIENLRGTILNDDLRGDASGNTIAGIAGDDTISSRGGNDVLIGGEGGDTLNGGAGTDRAQYTDSATGLIADLANAAANTGIAAGDSYISIEDLVGTGANDSLRGDDGNNLIGGLGGNDQITGRGGDDKLLGAGGNDVLFGGAGADVLNGAAGIDTAAYNDGTVAVRADLQNASVNTGTAAGDTYVNVENLRGTNANDDLRGDGGANQLDGLSGDDLLIGRDGDDKLRGASGDDTLLGGNGNDTLIGGGGSDIFRFASLTEGADTITDFQINSDVIQLNNAAFTSLSDGSLAPINFRLGAAAIDVNDYVIYDGSNLYYDADGNGAGAQILIATIANGAALDQNDFFVL